MTAKNVNYTSEMETLVAAEYAAGVAVDAIAAAVGKSTRSVVAKLSRMGLYNKPVRTTKSGDPIVRKNALADKLAALVSLTEAEATSLEKVNKTALVKLIAALS